MKKMSDEDFEKDFSIEKFGEKNSWWLYNNDTRIIFKIVKE